MDPPLVACGRRFVDVVEDTPAGRVVHEAGVGNDPRSQGLTQRLQERAVIRHAEVVDVHWHLMPYRSVNSIGADPSSGPASSPTA